MNFLPALKELVRAYQAFESYSARHLRTLGLTVTQFDVIATLGNQPPMTCKILGEKTFITKGTLTGVLERMEGKVLITRTANSDDGRSQMIALTPKGQKLFEHVFPVHLNHLNQAFKKLPENELLEAQKVLSGFKTIFLSTTI
jgi:MarR family transcriptional regulator, 2-MHQ and catechol-resistance regulon repressor